MERPDFFELKNGEKVKLPFTDKEYNDRVSKLRSVMDQNGLDMVILTSMHNVCLLYTSPSPRDLSTSRMPSSA